MSALTTGQAKGTVRRFINQLVEETDALRSKQHYRDWLLATANHWRYSPFNGLLIWYQRRTAVHVAGKKEWERRGREVKPDADPIFILAPSGHGRFIPVQVFDLADTTGPKLNVDSWSLRGGAKHVRKVEAAARRLGITLYAFKGRRHLMGYATHGRRVFMREGLSRADRLATLVHEYAHVELGHVGDAFIDRRRAELEAEAVAWAVLKALGARTKAPEYLAALGITGRELRASLHRIGEAARCILVAIDGRTPRRKKPKAQPPEAVVALATYLAGAAQGTGYKLAG